MEGNVLAMEPDSGGVMLAELTVKAPGSLLVQMVGSPKGDPGLSFRRESQSPPVVSGAMFLILELDQPFDGLLQISSDPMCNALTHLRR